MFTLTIVKGSKNDTATYINNNVTNNNYFTKNASVTYINNNIEQNKQFFRED